MRWVPSASRGAAGSLAAAAPVVDALAPFRRPWGYTDALNTVGALPPLVLSGAEDRIIPAHRSALIGLLDQIPSSLCDVETSTAEENP